VLKAKVRTAKVIAAFELLMRLLDSSGRAEFCEGRHGSVKN
jgi:hypothetical protein